MKKLLILACIALTATMQAQKVSSKELDFFQEEKFTFPEYQKHIGEVCFSHDDFVRDLSESKYIKTYTLGDKLSIRAFFPNSPANNIMVQLKESGMKIKEINTKKSSIGRCIILYNVYFDGQLVAGTSYAEYFSEESMQNLPTGRIDLVDKSEEKNFGESLYRSLLEKQDLLTPGNHKLRIEVLPYQKGEFSDFKFKPLAVGEIDVIVPKVLNVDASDCFPKSVMKDPALEAEVLKAVKVKFKENAGNALKAILPFEDIFIIRGDYGEIIKKSFFAAVVCKNSKGEVWYDYFIIDKMYDGKKYLPATVSKDARLNGYFAPSSKSINSACLKYIK